jgi:hypothetical protein
MFGSPIPDGTLTTCTSLLINDGRLEKAICKGPQVAYPLGQAEPDMQVTLATGAPVSGRRYCFNFSAQTGTTIVRDGSDGRSYRAARAGPSLGP